MLDRSGLGHCALKTVKLAIEADPFPGEQPLHDQQPLLKHCDAGGNVILPRETVALLLTLVPSCADSQVQTTAG